MMSLVREPNALDAAEAIRQAVYIADGATLLRRQPDQADEIHAEASEALRLICAFTQIEDGAVRGMLLQVAEVLAETLNAGYDA